jgi:hypothetical protein
MMVFSYCPDLTRPPTILPMTSSRAETLAEKNSGLGWAAQGALLWPCLHWRRLCNNDVVVASDSDMKQHLPWPPWATRQEIETILSVSCRPKWPRQVWKAISQYNIAGIFAYKSHQCKPSIISCQCLPPGANVIKLFTAVIYEFL